MSLGSCRTGVKGGKGLPARTGDAFGSSLPLNLLVGGGTRFSRRRLSMPIGSVGGRTEPNRRGEFVDRRQDGLHNMQRLCQ